MINFKHGMFHVKRMVTSRVFAVFMMAMSCLTFVFVISIKTKTVCIFDNGNISYIKTFSEDTSDILEQENIKLRQEDNIKVIKLNDAYSEVVIERAVPVSVTADGKTVDCYISNATVKDVLEKVDVELDLMDWVNYDLSKPVLHNDSIVVNRVEYETKVVSQPIPYDVKVKPSALLLKNSVKVLDKGEPGEKEQVIAEVYVDGELIDSSIVSESVIKEPVTEVQLEGTTASTSPFEPFSSVEVDETGRPKNYSKILENQVATAYSARDGAKTASGRYAIVGHVAVNPKVIPYGTKLFIESTNGNYVYGYAIAADTGTALMDGRVDVDLFFGSYQESVWFGKRSVKIYVLP